jgi:signal transduction histidine kinase
VQPADYRVPALIVFGILMIALIGFSGEVSSRLRRLAEQLGNRANQPRTSPITIEGPAEIRAVAAAANAFLAGEREGLEQRATLLSGMSHDLGTPATRLRLRSALVADPELRHKLEADIDQMTQMIEGVLAYTRNEMDEEEPRQVSVLALVESLADDYADTGQPVRLTPFEGVSIRSSPSIFSSGGPEHGHVAHERFRLVCLCRPNALRRALTNLIDNALKYGKSATLSLSADADTVTIHVDDEGSTLAEGDLDALTAPFERGQNASGKPGAGLGLTIVGSVARIHGGSLGFERLATGHRASLTIRRR